MTTAEKIQPALTQQQWTDRELDNFNLDRGVLYTYGATYAAGDPQRHALAALALYGQPFGFTPEDVAELLVAADHDEAFAPSENYVSTYRSLATRIAALLPRQ